MLLNLFKLLIINDYIRNVSAVLNNATQQEHVSMDCEFHFTRKRLKQ